MTQNPNLFEITRNRARTVYLFGEQRVRESWMMSHLDRNPSSVSTIGKIPVTGNFVVTVFVKKIDQ